LVSAGVHVFSARFFALRLCIQKFRSRRLGFGTQNAPNLHRNSAFWATVIRDLGPALQLFRIESERLKLSPPFSRRIAKPLDADAAGQATFYGCFHKIGRKEFVLVSASVSAGKKGGSRPSVSASKNSVPDSDFRDWFDDWVVGHQFEPNYLHHPVFPNRGNRR